jgi:hypothetical protein
MIVRALQLAFIVLAIAIIYPFSAREPVLFPKDTATIDGIVRTQKADRLPQTQNSEDETIVNASLPPVERRPVEKPVAQQSVEEPKTPDDRPFFTARASDTTQSDQDLEYLAYYAYSEVPPDKKPADLILATLKDTPVGTPVEEIKHATEALGIDFNFMKAVAKIESDFDPKQRTGSYIGLFQLRVRQIRFRQHHQSARQRHRGSLQIHDGGDPVRDPDAQEAHTERSLSDPSAGHSGRGRACHPSGACCLEIDVRHR